MGRLFLFVLIIGLTLASCRKDEAQGIFRPIKVEYPEAFRDTAVVDTFQRLPVADPYRWLENSSDPMTKRWIREQQSLTSQYLENMPFREPLRDRLRQLWQYERFSNPVKHGKYYYVLQNDGLQNQDVLYRLDDVFDSTPERVLDPNTLSTDGTVALTDYSFSGDGSMLAFQLSDSGSDWATIGVLDLENLRILGDTLRWVKFSEIAWHGDGFFYSRYAEPESGQALSGRNAFHQVFYHRVGDSQQADELVFADRGRPNRLFSVMTSDDERWLVIEAFESSSGNGLYFRDLRDRSLGFTPVVENFDHEFRYLGNVGNKMLVRTNQEAPNGRLLLIDTRKVESRYWEELVVESSDVLEDAVLVGDKIIVTYVHNAAHQLKVFDRTGRFLRTIELPGAGSVTAIDGDREGRFAYFTYTSFLQPPAVYELNLEELTTTLYRAPEIGLAVDSFETRQVWYESYDGVRIPMYLIHKKGLPKDGRRPTLLYGYGGFNISLLPEFNATRLNLFPVFLENGGVCAVANLRGGGEFGEKWHLDGTKENKQKVFDDFQSAAEYLIANRYTSPEKLAIYGRSNGGLLVGACMVQRPELYGVALPAVGVLDMLRYQHFTIGWAWSEEYGLSSDPRAFDYLYAYSPLHTVVGAKYPATLITTADHDDRVVPAHSYKFTAALQANQQSMNPVLIRISASAGHGAGKPTTQKIEEATDILAFTFYNLREEIRYQQEE